MKKLAILALVILIGFFAYYLLTPRQLRLSEDYSPEGVEIQQEAPVVEQQAPDLDQIASYYYSSDDARCEGELKAVYFEDIDKRYEYQEINAVVTQLIHAIPEGYKSAMIPGTQLNQLTIRQGVARVDLSSFLTLNGDKACGLEARSKQIRSVLMQFPEITEVILLSDGEEI